MMSLKRLLDKLKHLNRQRNLKTKILKKKIYFSYISLIKIRSSLVPAKYKNITILMTDLGIGDVIVASFLIKSLRDSSFNVSVIVEERIAYLFDGFIDVDKKILFRDLDLLKKQVKDNRIDLLIDLMDINDLTEKRIQIIHTIKPKHTIGFNQKNHVYDTSIKYKKYHDHFTSRMTTILNLLNVKFNDVKYYFNLPPSAYDEVNNFLFEHKINNKKIIAFNPFGSFSEKSFSYQQINNIINFMSKYEDSVLIIIGEKNKLSLINNVHKNVFIGNFSSFFASIALVELCDLLISVDTSIVHVGNAFNKKLISIYSNMQIGEFDSNIAWAPNYGNAKQIFTKEYKRTSIGDDISKMELDELFKEIEQDIALKY